MASFKTILGEFSMRIEVFLHDVSFLVDGDQT